MKRLVHWRLVGLVVAVIVFIVVVVVVVDFTVENVVASAFIPSRSCFCCDRDRVGERYIQNKHGRFVFVVVESGRNDDGDNNDDDDDDDDDGHDENDRVGVYAGSGTGNYWSNPRHSMDLVVTTSSSSSSSSSIEEDRHHPHRRHRRRRHRRSRLRRSLPPSTASQSKRRTRTRKNTHNGSQVARMRTTFRSGNPPPNALMKKIVSMAMGWDDYPYEQNRRPEFGRSEGFFDIKNFLIRGTHHHHHDHHHDDVQEDDHDYDAGSPIGTRVPRQKHKHRRKRRQDAEHRIRPPPPPTPAPPLGGAGVPIRKQNPRGRGNDGRRHPTPDEFHPSPSPDSSDGRAASSPVGTTRSTRAKQRGGRKNYDGPKSERGAANAVEDASSFVVADAAATTAAAADAERRRSSESRGSHDRRGRSTQVPKQQTSQGRASRRHRQNPPDGYNSLILQLFDEETVDVQEDDDDDDEEDERNSGFEDEDSLFWALPQQRGRERNSMPKAINRAIEEVFNYDPAEVDRKAEIYERQIGRGGVSSNMRGGMNEEFAADGEETVAGDGLNMKDNPRMMDADVDNEDDTMDPFPTRNNGSMFSEERERMLERIPPQVPAWGPTGNLGMDARTKAALDAMEEIREAKKLLMHRESRIEEVKEDLTILRADEILAKKRATSGGHGRISRSQLRRFALRIDNAKMALRRARLQARVSRRKLAAIEDRHSALLDVFDSQQESPNGEGRTSSQV